MCDQLHQPLIIRSREVCTQNLNTKETKLIFNECFRVTENALPLEVQGYNNLRQCLYTFVRFNSSLNIQSLQREVLGSLMITFNISIISTCLPTYDFNCKPSVSSLNLLRILGPGMLDPLSQAREQLICFAQHNLLKRQVVSI